MYVGNSPVNRFYVHRYKMGGYMSRQELGKHIGRHWLSGKLNGLDCVREVTVLLCSDCCSYAVTFSVYIALMVDE
jgi:hypothetical protein